MDQGGLNITQFVWLMLIAFIVALFARRLKAPYALALVFTGLLIGVSRVLPRVHLVPTILMTVFLPPLLFESAIHLRIGALRRDWKPIAIFTLAGTVLSTFIVGGLGAALLGFPLRIALVFGALISATDPIAVIAVFKRLGAGKRLSLILEAESLFNDGIAVVLFTVMIAAAVGSNASVLHGAWEFLRLMFGGAVLGALIGFLASRLHFEVDDSLVEITLTTVVAFGSYLVAESLHVSGVIAVVSAGLVIGNYALQTGMSPGTQLAVVAFWEYAVFVVNSIVFLLIGMEVSYVNWAHKAWLAVGAIAIVLAGRAVIYPLSLLVNGIKGKIPFAWQHVLFWGGLRGALSMALVLGLVREFPYRDTLMEATFAVVTFSLLVQGTTLPALLKRTGLARPERSLSATADRMVAETVACEAALMELDRLRTSESHPSWALEMLKRTYRERLETLREQIEELSPGYPVLAERRAAMAKRIALLSEKSVLKEAERRGWLGEDDWREIVARIDAELVELQSNE